MLRRHFTTLPNTSTPSISRVPGFVDLGLSVLWAECNAQADTPEELGMLKGPNVVPNLCYPTLDSELKAIINIQLPSPELVEELQNNTICSLAKVNGITGYKFKAKNGNSIFIPDGILWTSKYSGDIATTWRGLELYPDYEFVGGVVVNHQYTEQTRHVCSYPPEGIPLSMNKLFSGTNTEMYYFYPVPSISDTQSSNMLLRSSCEFIFNTTTPITANFYSTHTKITDTGESSLIMSRLTILVNDTQVLQFSNREVALALYNSASLIFIELVSNNDYTFYVTDWPLPNDIAQQSLDIKFDTKIAIDSRFRTQYYRLPYNSIKGKNLTVSTTSASVKVSFMSEYKNPPSSSASYVLASATVRNTKSATYDAATIASWESKTIDGIIPVLVKVVSSSSSNVKFTITD